MRTLGMKYHKNLIGTLAALTIVGCGESSPESATVRDVKDVQNVEYRLNDASFDAYITYDDGTSKQLQGKFHFTSGNSKDRVMRVISNGEFQLVVNGKPTAGLKILSGGQIQRTETLNANNNCILTGQSSMDGEAINLNFEFNWTLTADMSGAGCDDSANAHFMQFKDSEVDFINFQFARDLLASAGKFDHKIVHVDYVMHAQGDGF